VTHSVRVDWLTLHRLLQIQTAEPLVSWVIPDTKTIVRTQSLEALVIWQLPSRADGSRIGSVGLEAGLGQISRTTVSRFSRELRDRYHRASATRARPRQRASTSAPARSHPAVGGRYGLGAGMRVRPTTSRR
jgi:hypothetical protein